MKRIIESERLGRGVAGWWGEGEALPLTDQIPNLLNFLKVLSQFLHRELNTRIFAYFSFKLGYSRRTMRGPGATAPSLII